MSAENAVVFKGTKEGLVVLLDGNATFELIKMKMAKKAEMAAKFLSGYKGTLIFKGKNLTQEQEDELISIIRENTRIHITFVKSESETKSERNFLHFLETNDGVMTKYHYGSIRSGQEIEYPGCVVIVGDVNPGGVIKAGGSIIVLGALKGTAHAGLNGMEKAFVFAARMVPIQLKIYDIITRFPLDRADGIGVPEYAYAEKGKIFVLPIE